ncbi:MAG: deoxyguanosinetriphosphate triphosphohydrolase, partial [Planctomycetota bacterium]
EEFDDGLLAPLEGQLVDLADEIAYTAADLEDALAAGWIEVAEIKDLELWQRAWRAAEAASPEARAIHKRIRACKGLLASMADDVVSTTAANVAAGVDSPDAVRRAGRKLVSFSPDIVAAAGQLQEFLFDKVYSHPASTAKDSEARQIIRELFDAYTAEPALLPERYRQRIDAGAGSTLHRVVCDYIAGMTDRFCRAEHERICI